MENTARQAIAVVPELAAVYALTRRGWRWVSLTRGPGALVGYFEWPGCSTVDWCVIRGASEVEAVRVCYGEWVVWCRDGRVGPVAEELGALPPPGDPAAPRLITGRRWRPPPPLRPRG
ncbi:hypothetical protein [Actinoalloteichus caeruleus]|uniref:hypothetical protein n=1 Tax=Actinoalloteichus cyanogriseus TaxID=2893586 RepID=UPI0004ABCBA7|nr:hypothetical protein [Actinoalloteichus caeruleus]